MDFNFNSEKKQARIDNATKMALAEIQGNLADGIQTTELYIDKDISFAVRTNLEEAFKAHKQGRFSFQIVRRGSNPYTGRPESFTGMVIGDQKYYKIYYMPN